MRLRAIVMACSAALAACSTAPPKAPSKPASYVVLLDNGDGTTGQLKVTGPTGSTVLDADRSAIAINGPARSSFVVNDALLRSDFAAAIAASPRRPVTFRLYFEYGASALNARSREELPRILEEIEKRSAPDLSIVGHTDTRGDAARNLALGLARAKAVADLVVATGRITPDKVTIESNGERFPLVGMGDNRDEPRNRRVEIMIR